jgi:hypothetical protein
VVVGLPPDEQHELVGDGDHERDEQGLGDCARVRPAIASDPLDA